MTEKELIKEVSLNFWMKNNINLLLLEISLFEFITC